MTDNLKLVIVGHVDHGKSTLIGRLLYDTDSLPDGKLEEIKEICRSLGKDVEFSYVMDNLAEERGQGITIDTAQRFFATEKRQYNIIDAPGHVEFIKNMITGASQAEAAIIIIDAEEGVSEQTRRHAYILGMLGLTQVIVAVNKMDLVEFKEEKFREVENEINSFLATIKIKPNYVIPISARDGDFVAKKSDKMGWYAGPTILSALDSFKAPKGLDDAPLRYPIQDAYKFDEKRIFAGRVASGILRAGDEVVVMPTGEKTKIKQIVEWESDKTNPFGKGRYSHPQTAEAGKSTGVTLADKLFLDRGSVISSPQNAPKTADRFRAHVFWLDKQPYRKGERMRIKCATQEVMCEIEKIEKVIDSSTLTVLSEDASEIRNREVADIIVKTAQPIALENFNSIPELGRFVFERSDTCAGGIITEV